MTSFNKIKIINADIELVKNVIANVEEYPDFIPWCREIEIIEIVNKNHFIAKMTIYFKGISQSYISDIKIEKIEKNNNMGIDNNLEKEYIINVIAKPGIFSNLTTKWKLNSTLPQPSLT
ncbi:MAG TPA: SRPBCC family protein, partial [Candidatus Megaira endosymbiont of Hartmannula sinica]|nr:SRPBCC family protein [Candidatus Megaera endosymbiont of Hartmannula sinica]